MDPVATDRERIDPLGMDPALMRRLGHCVVDLVADHFEGRASGPAVVVGDAAQLLDELGGGARGGPPRTGGDPDAAIERLARVVLGTMQHGDHPRFFAGIPGPSSAAGVLGEWLATGFNAFAASWVSGSGPTAVELTVLDWLRALLGLPASTEGVLVSGGSLASLTAFAAARAVVGTGTAYLSDQAHPALRRALLTLGYPSSDIRVISSDDGFRIPPGALAEAVARDEAAGRRPTLVAATAGTTNTGAVDPLPALADLCARHGLWLHVDGAYGAPAALCPAGRAALDGLELADSIVLDPHKWLFQPYDIGCVLVRRPGALERAFAISAEYLKPAERDAGQVDLRDRAPELSRRGRALKLWLTFQIHGTAGIAAAVARGIELAEYAETELRRDGRWEVVTPAALGIVTFVPRSEDADVLRASAALRDDGYAFVTTTLLRGRRVLRLCTINPTTTEEDIRGTLERLLTLALA